MSEVCLEELFALISVHGEEGQSLTELASQPPSSGDPTVSRTLPQLKERGIGADIKVCSGLAEEPAHELFVRLAQTAAPYLILRCALSIRAYVADQPLRGRMPQPLSQRKELTRILRCLVDLRSEPEAIPDAPNVESERRKHLLRLYPLLVGGIQVAGTAGDDKVLSLIREALDVVGGEFGV